jgi:hypothetical protein
MFATEELHGLARRLAGTADRVDELTTQLARKVEDVEWECPRGDRAVREARALAASGQRDSDHLREAATELGRIDS